jgi:hypothetical protein
MDNKLKKYNIIRLIYIHHNNLLNNVNNINNNTNNNHKLIIKNK